MSNCGYFSRASAMIRSWICCVAVDCSPVTPFTSGSITTTCRWPAFAAAVENTVLAALATASGNGTGCTGGAAAVGEGVWTQACRPPAGTGSRRSATHGADGCTCQVRHSVRNAASSASVNVSPSWARLTILAHFSDRGCDCGLTATGSGGRSITIARSAAAAFGSTERRTSRYVLARSVSGR